MHILLLIALAPAVLLLESSAGASGNDLLNAFSERRYIVPAPPSSDDFYRKFIGTISGEMAEVEPCDRSLADEKGLVQATLAYRSFLGRSNYEDAGKCALVVRRAMGFLGGGNPFLDLEMRRVAQQGQLLGRLENPRISISKGSPIPACQAASASDRRFASLTFQGKEDCHRLLLDTGATLTVMSPDTLDALGGQKLPLGPFGTIDMMSFTTFSMENVLVGLQPPARLAPLEDAGFDGVIGLHMLTGAVIEGSEDGLSFEFGSSSYDDEDFDHSALLLYDGSKLLVPVTVGETRTVCSLDTGASQSLLASDLLPAGVMPEEELQEVTSLDGAVQVRRVQAMDVEIGGVAFTLRDVSVPVSTSSRAASGSGRTDYHCTIGMSDLRERNFVIDIPNHRFLFDDPE